MLVVIINELAIRLRNKPMYDKLQVLIINKDVRKSLTRKNGNENPIWSWNDSTQLLTKPCCTGQNFSSGWGNLSSNYFGGQNGLSNYAYCAFTTQSRPHFEHLAGGHLFTFGSSSTNLVPRSHQPIMKSQERKKYVTDWRKN